MSDRELAKQLRGKPAKELKDRAAGGAEVIRGKEAGAMRAVLRGGLRHGSGRRWMFLCLLGCAGLLGILGCSRPVNETQSHGGPIRDHVSFVDALRREGYTVEIAGEIQQPFLRAKGTRLRLSGGGLAQPAELQSYDYEDPDAARADADRIGPGGNPKDTQVEWIAPPHFHLRGQVLVLYLGSDPKVIQLLNGLLGSQVAGR